MEVQDDVNLLAISWCNGSRESLMSVSSQLVARYLLPADDLPDAAVEQFVEAATQYAARYSWVVTFKEQRVIMPSLYMIGTSNQWRSACLGCVRPRSHFRVPLTTWDAAFDTHCSLLLRPHHALHVMQTACIISSVCLFVLCIAANLRTKCSCCHCMSIVLT